MVAFLAWGAVFYPLVNLPPTPGGQHIYQIHPLSFTLIALVPPMLVALGFLTGMGLFQLRPWARKGALLWATIALAFCLSMIALRPFETFAIPEHIVSDVDSMRQLLAVSVVFMLLPVSVWWLFFFRLRGVVKQFEGSPEATAPPER